MCTRFNRCGGRCARDPTLPYRCRGRRSVWPGKNGRTKTIPVGPMNCSPRSRAATGCSPTTTGGWEGMSRRVNSTTPPPRVRSGMCGLPGMRLLRSLLHRCRPNVSRVCLLPHGRTRFENKMNLKKKRTENRVDLI